MHEGATSSYHMDQNVRHEVGHIVLGHHSGQKHPLDALHPTVQPLPGDAQRVFRADNVSPGQNARERLELQEELKSRFRS